MINPFDWDICHSEICHHNKIALSGGGGGIQNVQSLSANAITTFINTGILKGYCTCSKILWYGQITGDPDLAIPQLILELVQ